MQHAYAARIGECIAACLGDAREGEVWGGNDSTCATIVHVCRSHTRVACHTLLTRVPRSLCVRDWGGKEEEREGPVGTGIEVIGTWLIAGAVDIGTWLIDVGTWLIAGAVDTADRGRAAAFWPHTSIYSRPSLA